MTHWIGHGELSPFNKDGGNLYAWKFAAHGTVQGIAQVVAGGHFASGFASGVAGHFSGELTRGWEGTGAGDVFGRTMIAATFGGMSSAATGGDFLEGAKTAAIVHLFNDESGRLAQKDVTPKQCSVGGACSALMKLIAHDDAQSSPLGTTLSSEYNALSFSDDMLGLNHDFESLGGPVDIDWMLRSTGGSLGRVPGLSHAIYGGGKILWNSVRLRNPFENFTQSGNFNAPSAARMWMSEGMTLRQIFAPAITTCGCSL